MDATMKPKMFAPEEVVSGYPPAWCSAICYNSLSNLCIEDCAIAKDCRHFKLKRGIQLEQLARFPLEEFLNEMPPHARQIVIGIYMSKISDYLQYHDGNGAV